MLQRLAHQRIAVVAIVVDVINCVNLAQQADMPFRLLHSLANAAPQGGREVVRVAIESKSLQEG